MDDDTDGYTSVTCHKYTLTINIHTSYMVPATPKPIIPYIKGAPSFPLPCSVIRRECVG